MNGEELSCVERIAKIIVNHWITFKECKHHTTITGDHMTRIKEFVNERHKLLQRIPEFADPDFAQINRLPTEARLTKNENEEIEDE
jgi:hypothetical protein